MRFPRRVALARSQTVPTPPAGRSWLHGSRLARWSVLTMLPGLLGLVLLVGAPAPSSATPGVNDYPSWLMKRPKDGYVDPWNFYSRECTSFVAWRLNNDNDVPFTNQYKGHHWGNAGIWKRAALDSGVAVDDTPAVGAVAWWSSSSTSGGLGHVAWVYQTNGSSITVEEYNYLRSGYYDQRVITRGDRHWPDGFIHVADLGATNTAAPRFTGRAQVGRVLKGYPGTWSRSGLDYSYQWYAGNSKISWATHRKIRLRAGQLGKRVRVKVTASAASVAGRTAQSPLSSQVAPGRIVNSAPPTVSGDAQVGGTLAADPGTWSPSAAYSYQWLVDGRPVDGAITSTYSPQPADVGHVVSVAVTASQAGYSDARATSAGTGAVAQGQFTLGAPPSITGTPQVDQQLAATPGTWSPRARYAYQWYADGKPLPGATGRTFSPGAAQVGRVLSVGVTGTRAGYTDTPRQSAATTQVRPGQLTRVARPRISGTPQVGEQLTASPGRWTPDPSAGQIGVSPYRFQWLAAGQPIAGATGDTFTPTAAQVDQRLTVQVTANRPGYTADTQSSVATTPVARGRLANLTRPSITGDPLEGQTLTAHPGTWTAPVGDSEISYRWLADGRVVSGADQPTLVLTRQQVGKRIQVRVTATPAGYDAAHTDSRATAEVLHGRAGFDGTPRITGRARLGRTLTVATGSYTPPGTTPHYQWYRGSSAITGATGRSHTATAADLGRALSVEVSLTPRLWAPVAMHTAHTTLVRAWPHMSVHTSTRDRRVRVEVSLSATGVPRLGGRQVLVSEGDRSLGEARVRRGEAVLWLPRMHRGTHELTVTYTGNRKVTHRTRVVDVRVH